MESRELSEDDVTRSLSVTDWLRQKILSGKFVPGERLQEVRLSETLGVSRTPVRAALHSLAAAGLVDYAPNRGYAVRDFSASDLIDAFEIRAALEGVGARFAAERGIDAPGREAIENALTQGDELLAKAGELGRTFFEAYAEVNFAFHDVISEASKNRMLSEMTRLACEKPGVSSTVIVEVDIERLVARHREHHHIYEALLAREPALAERLMREHVSAVKIGVVRALRSGGSMGYTGVGS